MNEAKFLESYNLLNPQQKEAVDQIEGPVMVLAGPGTGKTQILALRIANILRQTQMAPQNILALTFTESGVLAMRERLIGIIGQAAYYVQIHTFHSFSNRVIQENPTYFQSQRELKMLTDLDRIKLLQTAMKTVKLEHLTSLHNQFFYLNTISRLISDLKRENVRPDKFVSILLAEHEDLQNRVLNEEIKEDSIVYKRELKRLQKNKDLGRVYKKFQELMTLNGYYDFDDMILNVIEAFEKYPDLVNGYQERFQYFLADEYQDTNSAQNQILFKLTEFFETPNLFVVGDDDQAIYRFQGASVENLYVFLDKYANAKKINLKTNYRSTQLVLDAAHSVIVNNQMRVKDNNHKLEAHSDVTSKPIDFYQFMQGEQETKFIIEEINRLTDEGVAKSEIAVIVRDNADLLDIANALKQNSIPFYSHLRDNILTNDFIDSVISSLRLIADPKNNSAFVHTINLDWFGVSSLAFYKLAALRKSNKANFFDLILDIKLLDDFSDKEQNELMEFGSKILELNRQMHVHCLSHFAKVFLENTGILTYITKQDNRFEYLRHLTSFINLLEVYNANDADLSLAKFLDLFDTMKEYRLKVPEQSWQPKSDLVQLMTAHRSKGLEFDYVFMPKLYDGKWANKVVPKLIALPETILQVASNQTKEPNEDERRLFFVALTRARRHVYLSQSNFYHYLGVDRETLPALFVNEIDDELLLKHEIENVDELEIANLLESKLENSLVSSHSEQEKAYLSSLLANFRMSPSALSTWQEDKSEFFRRYILRLPQEYSSHLELGIAVHSSLEWLFLEIKVGRTPNLEKVLSYFETKLDKQILDEGDKKLVKSEGVKMLTSWYQNYQSSFSKPLYLEYSFAGNSLNLEGVPLTGKLDKVELTGSGNRDVRIIDYKTGSVKSKNAILGKTKNSDGKIYQQLVFYKLMADLDPNFTYNVKEVVIDFVKPRASGKHARLCFVIPQADVDALKKEILEAYKQIQSFDYGLEFGVNK